MPPDTHQRRRARQACTHCNARRVKCNVTEKVPCDNCVAAGTECQLRVSRRGKHPRYRPGQEPKQTSASQSQSKSPSRTAVKSSTQIQPPPPPSPPATAPAHPSLPHQPAQPIPAVVPPRSDNFAFTGTSASPSDEPPSLSKSEYTSPNDEEMSQASLALASLSRGIQRDVKPDIKLQGRQEFGASIFWGESSSIRYVGTDNLASAVAKLDSIPYEAGGGKDRPDYPDPRLENLINKPGGPFTLPPRHATASLLRAYFQWFHPFCPIVDEQDIWHQFETGSLSTLLLQSLLLVAASHCDDSVITDVAFGNRSQAKLAFYTRAAELYDANTETQSLVIIQSVILLSFWRGRAAEEKDTRHWLGIAISIAQRRGLHRSRNQGKIAPDACVPDRQKKLARRLWWSVYMHEKQSSATLGLPQRVRDEDCDGESLEAADFEHAFSSSRPQEEKADAIDYTMRITQLSTFLGKVLEVGYSPKRTSTEPERTAIRNELVEWKQTLPASLRIDEDIGSQPSLHAAMIHLAYNNVVVLLYRNCFTDLTFDKEGQYALQAGARNARIVEDMLPRGILRHAQIHVITNISNTLVLNIMELRFAKGMSRTSADHRSKICLLGLAELQSTWEFRNWLLQLFIRRVDVPGGDRRRIEETEAQQLAIKTETPLQASYGAAMSRENSGGGGLIGNLAELDCFAFNLSNEIMDPMTWPVDEKERFLFSQIYNSNPFW
ncbi:Transcription factor [Cordyceps fumosorosea ARSEF 2679]|uniref:Transcription factor n=1 Tax=Cordyceps fumosorosea (strain ARSEF 2679) TaxID=1081104 RepID=A0A167RKD0_CORFA|nr:Transcription factor [Cordyceps fumosorosea ARSEF 2679]OAA58680.1 Transcription factor [Cordyceps fumosorosea ARSEF 2679]